MATDAQSGDGVPQRARRVAVVGAGFSGIVSCRFLRAAGHEPVCFEAAGEVGGIWGPRPLNDVVYPGLVSNIPTIAMRSSDLDFQPCESSYVSSKDIGDFAALYADHFEIRRFIRFNSNVRQVSPLCSEEQEARGEAKWRVTWTVTGAKDEASCTSSEDFDAVVVATGHYDAPYTPEIPGQQAWLAAGDSNGDRRRVVHAREYKGPKEYAARVVLVVGSRSSGSDVSREVSGTAGFLYSLHSSCSSPCGAGHCTEVPLGTEIRPDGHLAFNGEVIPGPPINDIILATGYIYKFPFLDSSEVGLEFPEGGRCVLPLYLNVVHARRPSLFFIGIPLQVPAPVSLFEAEARFMISYLSSSRLDEQLREAQEWVDARKQTVGVRLRDMHVLGGRAWEHFRILVRTAGMTGDEYEKYDRRLTLVENIYKECSSRKPQKPWGDDWYRRVQIDVDWNDGTWKTELPTGAPLLVQ
eukprot:TRINITY_DN104935_c0_g1_i1.p1 TRINITY_DN104935_c0_g1~~TRINITY_DN104935_c0_g1_i1.p1  ORF type:complete len:484 (-),score=46.01 TRINITY_DN104935_c0_g1_i1:123-1523(-)